jgi:hypothetical protein
MREIRLYGSEGGGALRALPTPITLNRDDGRGTEIARVCGTANACSAVSSSGLLESGVRAFSRLS